jgi:hypothetical protein
MKLELARAFATASISDQVTAVQLVDHMRFDRLATRNPAQWAAAVREELHTAGMPTHLLDGPRTPAERLVAAKAKHHAAWQRLVAARTFAKAAELELGAYCETYELLGGRLAEATWTADLATWTATTAVNGVRYRYSTPGLIGIGQRLCVLTACPTNPRHDHAAQVGTLDVDGLARLLDRPNDPAWVCERGLCPPTRQQPADSNSVAPTAADGCDPDPGLDAALQELADVLDGEPLSTSDQP